MSRLNGTPASVSARWQREPGAIIRRQIVRELRETAVALDGSRPGFDRAARSAAAQLLAAGQQLDRLAGLPDVHSRIRSVRVDVKAVTR